jgi:outer membrane lipoprotein-sorting protein
VNLIRKEDVNQSTILLGHIGGLLNNPDYFALEVMNSILSGGFSSRLFSHVRSDQGLAYAVFGAYGANYNYPGQFYAGCMTKSETTVKAVRSLLHEIEMMKKEEVTDDELALAKESYLNSFVFNFDTRGEVVNRLMTYEYYGYPKDFLEQTKTNIEKVNKAEVLRVAQKYLQPDKVRILVVGKDKDFEEPLSVLGKVNEIDISIPVKEEKAPEATGTSLAKGKELLNKAVTACGGAAFKTIKTMQWKGNMTAVTPQGDMALTAHFIMLLPDRFRINIGTPMGEMSQIMNGEQAWIISPQGTMPAPGQVKDEMKANLWRDFVFLFANANREDLAAQHLGSEEVAGQKCEALLITPKDVKSFKLYVDAATMMPVKLSYQGMNMMGAPSNSEEMFSDFREVSGVKLPFKSVTNQDGKKSQEAAATEIVVNAAVEENMFMVKP